MDKSVTLLFWHCIEILREIQKQLNSKTISELLKGSGSAPGTDDLQLHALPREIIRRKLIEEYDPNIALITTFEDDNFDYSKIEKAQYVAFVDHIDSSMSFKRFLEARNDNNKNNVSDNYEEKFSIEGHNCLKEDWERFISQKQDTDFQVNLSAPCCSITLVKKGYIIFSLFFNYITQEVFTAIEDGIQYNKLDDIETGDFVKKWKKIFFKPADSPFTYITFISKDNYKTYLEESQSIYREFKRAECWHTAIPRILYLSDLKAGQIPGFILSNGERIGKWIGWLAFCQFSKELIAYSVYPKTTFAKDGILVSPSPLYSVIEIKNGSLFLNYEKLKFFIRNPSKYRETILITQRQNYFVRSLIESVRSREII